MKKIPTVLVRDPDDRAHVIWFELTPGCEWITEASATRKYDGTCTMLDTDGKWWARREVKKGATPPPNFVTEDFDPVTGKTQGWEPIEQSSFARFHDEALQALTDFPSAGTYELVGPKINGNPERASRHHLIEHASAESVVLHINDIEEAVSTAILVASLSRWEGIVWHHSDGRMAKLKVKDLPGCLPNWRDTPQR